MTNDADAVAKRASMVAAALVAWMQQQRIPYVDGVLACRSQAQIGQARLVGEARQLFEDAAVVMDAALAGKLAMFGLVTRPVDPTTLATATEEQDWKKLAPELAADQASALASLLLQACVAAGYSEDQAVLAFALLNHMGESILKNDTTPETVDEAPARWAAYQRALASGITRADAELKEANKEADAAPVDASRKGN